MASLIIPAIATVLGGGLLATAAATAVYVAGTTLLARAAYKVFVPKPKMPNFDGMPDGMPSYATQNRGTLVNARVSAGPQEYVFGEVRKGGVVTFMEVTGTNNSRLHMIVTLAGHEVESIGEIYVNDEIAALDSSGYASASKWGGKLRVLKHLGGQTNAYDQFANAPTTLADTLHAQTSADANFVGLGIAYIYVVMDYDADIFTSGVPTFTAVIQGAKVYDPRNGSIGYSANAALCLRHYLTASYGLADSSVDDTYFSAAANDCDDAISLIGGGTEARYEINGVVSAESATGQTLQDMVSACAGRLFPAATGWKLKVGVYESPIEAFTLDDVRSALTVPTRRSRADNANRVVGTFSHGGFEVDGGGDWVETDYPAIESDAFLVEDANIVNTLDLPLMMTTSPAMAQRIAKQALFRGREQISFTADFGLRAIGVEVGDIVTFSASDYGWVNKEFEVTAWRLFVAEGGALRVSMTLQEISAAVFDWDAEETAITANNTQLLSVTSVPDVGLSVSSELRLVNEQVVGALLIDVTSGAAEVDFFEVSYKKSTSESWVGLGRSKSTRFEAVGIADGNFDVRARAVNGFGIAGQYTTRTNQYVSLFASPPGDVLDFSANVIGSVIHLSWTPVSDLDLSHYRLRFSTNQIDATYENAVDLVKKVPRPGNSIQVPAQSGTYFIKAVDKIGNPSVNPSSVVVLTNLAEVENLQLDITSTQDPDFAGAKTNVSRLNNDGAWFLSLDGQGLFDDATGLFDDAQGALDGGGGLGYVSSGQYDFDNHIDFGALFVARIRATLDVVLQNNIDTFDETLGLFDAYAGLFDGSNQNDAANVRLQFAQTNDDPAGSPTWTSFRDFIVADLRCRALKFRVLMETSDSNVTPTITGLSVFVDMPDRMEGERDITFTGSYDVLFDNSFRDTPSIGISATLASGDRYAISDKNADGFTFSVYTGESLSTNPATFDYVAKGYGKGIALT